MSVGKMIRSLRKRAGKTQAQLADSLGVSFQAVSSWENEDYLPDVERLKEISECLGVGVSKLLEETKLPDWTLRDRLADESHMHTMLKAALRQSGFPNAYKALGFIDSRCCTNATLKRRTLHTACHALALEIGSDETLTLLLLGGLAKEMNIPFIELPAVSEYRDALRDFVEDNVTSGSAAEAQLAECIDGVYLLSTAAIDMTRGEIVKVAEKAEKVILPLLQTLKNEKPEWNNAVYLLRYQALALLETYKRLL